MTGNFNGCAPDRTLQASHALGADRLDRGPLTVQWQQASARGFKLEARSPTQGRSSALAMRTVLTTLANFAEKATRNVHRLFDEESRKHCAAIEVEMYLYRYHHSSKNDDDLPVIR